MNDMFETELHETPAKAPPKRKLDAACEAADEAIEYATGAHDPQSYPQDGYAVDAAGTFTG